MDRENLLSEKTYKKLGFHYYGDAGHFDEASMDFWFPKLQAAGTRWLVICLSQNVSVPQEFIDRLKSIRIEPIVIMNLSISEPPSQIQFEQTVRDYAEKGIRLIQFFNKPNLRRSYTPEDWMKPGLVKRFTERFAAYASIAIREKIIPIYPLLEPGGDYWDLAFFESSLKILKENYSEKVLPNLVFSAYCGLNEHPISWNAEGPAEYGYPAPYEQNGVNHCGFYLYKWYHDLIVRELGKNYPMILFRAGKWAYGIGELNLITKESRQEYLKILNITQNEANPLPNFVLACCLYKLPSSSLLYGKDISSDNRGENIFDMKRKPKTQGKSVKIEIFTLLFGFIKKISAFGFSNILKIFKSFGTNFVTICKYLIGFLSRGKNPLEYFLLPQAENLFTQDQLVALEGFIKLHHCESGTDSIKASKAKTVYMLNNSELYPPSAQTQLQGEGCDIKIISLQD